LDQSYKTYSYIAKWLKSSHSQLFPEGSTVVSYKKNYLVLNNTFVNRRKLETVLNSLNIYKNKDTKKVRIFTLHEMTVLEKLKADCKKMFFLFSTQTKLLKKP
jgi:hypothetical protein